MKKGLKKMHNRESQIPLKLNDYEDIFSDLDPRDYSYKALSGDFLSECKKASLDKKKVNELNLFIPKNKRNLSSENKIKERLKGHFHKHYLEKKKEISRIRLIGSIWFGVGCFLTVITALLMEVDTSFFMKILINVAHPGGWFFLWEGLGKILIHSKEKRSDFSFYRKMNRVKINFLIN